MGANRAGDNLKRKRKRHVKNLRTQFAAADQREKGVPAVAHKKNAAKTA